MRRMPYLLADSKWCCIASYVAAARVDTPILP
jgi:hypothetical protein